MDTKGTKLSSYSLPVHKPERNFPQAEKKQWYNLSELTYGDYAGMTETDSKTSGKEDGQYTPINKKSGPGGISGGTKHGFDVKLDKHSRIG